MKLLKTIGGVMVVLLLTLAVIIGSLAVARQLGWEGPQPTEQKQTQEDEESAIGFLNESELLNV